MGGFGKFDSSCSGASLDSVKVVTLITDVKGFE